MALLMTWFSDESHFYLNGIENKRNCPFRSSEKPNVHMEKPLHGEKVTLWVATMSSTGITGHFCFQDKDGNNETVNSMRYLHILKRNSCYIFIGQVSKKGSLDFSRTEQPHTHTGCF